MLNELSKCIADARKNSIKLNKEESVKDTSIVDAYEIQKLVVQNIKKNISGWKLGGTNSKTRKNFNVSSLYWGPVFEGNISEESNFINLARGEIEVAFKLHPSIEDLSKVISPDDLSSLVASVALSIEYPWSVFESFGEAGVKALIADCCASGQCLLGASVAFKDFSGEAIVKIMVDNLEVETGSTENLIDGLYQTLCDFINAAHEEGFVLKGGQWVFTGGITSCRTYEQEAQVEIKCDTLPNISLS